MKKLFSVVIPVYGNELNLPIIIPYIMENYPKLFPEYDFELILVNDGSPDNSWEIMQEYQKQYPDIIRIASFVRNYGQGAATRYGLSIAKGDVVGVISCDLQDPFELFADMLKEYEKGYEFVGGQRSSRDEGGLSILCSKMTHFLMHNIVSKDYPNGGCDFYLISRTALRRFLATNPKYGSSRILMFDVSHGIKFLPYVRRKREVGKSGYNLFKKISIFIDMFVSNTYFPLRVMSVTGFSFAGIAFVYALVIFIKALLGGGKIVAPNLFGIVVLITFFSGLILASLGIVGEYMWRIYDWVRNKPPYQVLYSPEDIQQFTQIATLEEKNEH